MKKRKDKVLEEELSDPLEYPLHAEEKEGTVFQKLAHGSEEEETECN